MTYAQELIMLLDVIMSGSNYMNNLSRGGINMDVDSNKLIRKINEDREKDS